MFRKFSKIYFYSVKTLNNRKIITENISDPICYKSGKKTKMNNKGFTVSDMLPLGLTIVVLGIGLSLGLTVLADFQTDQVSGSNAYNGTGEAITGLTKFTNYLPTIALVIVVAVIIGIIVRYLFTR